MNKQDWVEINQKIESLRKLHDEAIANYEKCREFANRMSLFLSELEDLGYQSMAYRATDILLFCIQRWPHSAIKQVWKKADRAIKSGIERSSEMQIDLFPS